jgi:hypothetical protein
MIRRLATRFPEIDVDFIGGNHGRIGKFGDERFYDNFDLITGQIVTQGLVDLPNVQCKVWTTPHALVQIGASLVHLHHGDKVKSFMGLPYYGLERAASRWTGLHQQFFKYIMVGHWHNPAAWDTNSGAEIIVNGSFFTGSAYSVNDLGLATPAAQWAFFLHRERGITARYKVGLSEESITRSKTTPRVEWA